MTASHTCLVDQLLSSAASFASLVTLPSMWPLTCTSPIA